MRAIFQRKERQGWKDGKRYRIPKDRPIEYCAVHAGSIWKGATLLARYSMQDAYVEGSPAWLLIRQLDVDEVVWRDAH